MRSKSNELMNRIIEFIDNQYNNTGIIPTMREIAAELNISAGCVSNYIEAMKNKGLIKGGKLSRSYITNNMSKKENSIKHIPVVGTIACGSPLLAEENIERYLPLPNEFLKSGNHFILKAHGDSMINAGINNGDYVVVKQQETAENGQIIVALIENEATLKRYFLDNENKKIRLHPENPKMEDMYFDNIIIQGIAVKVIKDII